MIPKRLLLLLALCLGLFGSAFAQGAGSPPQGAADGSYWRDDDTGDTTRLDVTDNPNGGAWTNTVSAGGFSGVADGQQGADTPGGATTCTNSGVMTDASGNQYRVKDGKLQKKVNGRWKTLRKVKPPKKPKKKTNTTRRSGSSTSLMFTPLGAPVIGWVEELPSGLYIVTEPCQVA